MIAHAVVMPRCGEPPVCLSNIGAEAVTVYKGMRIGQAEKLQSPEVTCITPTESDIREEDALPDHKEIPGNLYESPVKRWRRWRSVFAFAMVRKNSCMAYILPTVTSLPMTTLTLVEQVESSIGLSLVMPLPFGSRYAQSLKHKEGKQEDSFKRCF